MSMTKLVEPGSWDLGATPLARVKLAGSGLSGRGLRGRDLQDFVKRAGHHLAHEMRQLSFQPGEVPIHLIAMGCTEGYSSNRNGDGFRESVLQTYHPTFVKNARFFRDHANTDTSRSYGIVKASYYNDVMRRVELICALNGTKEAAARNKGLLADRELQKLDSDREIQVSMATRVPFDVCFPAGTLVETETGDKVIEDVLPGELVKTHTGEYRSVTRLIRNPYAGTAVSARIFGLPDLLTMTEAHPVLVARQEQFRRCRGTVGGQKRRHTYRNGDTCITCKTSTTTQLDWVAARDLHVGDYLVYPVTEPGEVEVGLSQAYLAGIYAGNGSPIRQRRSRDRTGELYLQGIEISQGTAHPAVIARIQQAAKAVHGRDQKAHPEKDKEAVQLHVYHQTFASNCLTWVGEGSRSKRISRDVFTWNREHRLTFLAGLLDADGSVDRGVQNGAGRINSVNREFLLQVQKLFWGLGIPVTLSCYESTCGFSETPMNCYQLYISCAGVAALQNYSAKAAVAAVARKSTHSRAFLVGGYIHLPVQELHHRYAECDVYNFSVTEHESYIAGGVAVHNCSWCHNKAATRKDYCTERTCSGGGLRDNITSVLKCGHVLHADNPHCKFFDISHVVRGADPTAAVTGRLEKAAGYLLGSASSGRAVLGGAALAELYAPGVPAWLSEDESIQFGPVCKLACALDRLEGPDVPVLRRPEPLPALPAVIKLAEALRALADVQVILPLEGYLHLASGDAVKAAACAAASRPALRGVFARIAASGEADDLARLAGLDCRPGHAAAQWAHKVAQTRSLSQRQVLRQIHLAALSADTESDTQQLKSAALDNPGAVQVARLYGGYTLAALQIVEGSHKENRLTRLALLAQNRF